jgi:hypothetical protein
MNAVARDGRATFSAAAPDHSQDALNVLACGFHAGRMPALALLCAAVPVAVFFGCAGKWTRVALCRADCSVPSDPEERYSPARQQEGMLEHVLSSHDCAAHCYRRPLPAAARGGRCSFTRRAGAVRSQPDCGGQWKFLVAHLTDREGCDAVTPRIRGVLRAVLTASTRRLHTQARRSLIPKPLPGRCNTVNSARTSSFLNRNASTRADHRRVRGAAVVDRLHQPKRQALIFTDRGKKLF